MDLLPLLGFGSPAARCGLSWFTIGEEGFTIDIRFTSPSRLRGWFTIESMERPWKPPTRSRSDSVLNRFYLCQRCFTVWTILRLPWPLHDSPEPLKTLHFQWFRFISSHNTIYRKSTNLRFMHYRIDPAGVVNRNRNGRMWRRAFPFANWLNLFAFTKWSVTSHLRIRRKMSLS